MAVFRGGFSREAAEHVAGASLSVLSVLVAKSLVRRTRAQSSPRTGQGRYDLHDLVRQYALAYLNEDEQEYRATRSRHCQYYAALLEQRGAPFKLFNCSSFCNFLQSLV